MREVRLGAWRGSAWPVRYYPAYPRATATTHPARTVPGQHFPHHPVDLRPRDLGHLSPPKPVVGSAEKLRPAGTWLCGDASPPRCGSRTRPAPRRFSQSRTPFLYATGSLLRMPGSPMGYPPERWTGSSGVRCHPDSGGKWPSGFRRASACWLDEPSER